MSPENTQWHSLATRTIPNSSKAPIKSLSFRSCTGLQKKNKNAGLVANRLEPELIRELDLLVIPGGTEMPSYDVRKELQIRYSVDRRYIYDWFRGKGLRAKEDKRVPTGSQRYESSSPSNYHTSTQISTPSENSSYLECEVYHPVVPPRGPHPASHLPIYPEHAVPLAAHFPERSFLDALYSSPPDATFESNPSTISHFLGTGQPFITVTDSSSLTPTTHIINNSSRSLLLWDTTFCSEEECSESAFPFGTLRKAERMAMYDFLSNIIGPAHGIQESVGSYGAYMNHHSNLYYQRLLEPYHRTREYTVPQDRLCSSPCHGCLPSSVQTDVGPQDCTVFHCPISQMLSLGEILVDSVLNEREDTIHKSVTVPSIAPLSSHPVTYSPRSPFAYVASQPHSPCAGPSQGRSIGSIAFCPAESGPSSTQTTASRRRRRAAAKPYAPTAARALRQRTRSGTGDF
ncbi:hypothetical protein JAAARDRAFT_188675 [Jaapia argillacea MUCL 33604]|uniref:Uncharacterized protein n=1 Tax=Jaapia argillacea MUCL 33604 TaxID=933084 RepID=A0A067QHR5_9AGAM|nr:hypothetical protein JAAARDRAFT_188675 [Jaapia argillacea MUCL 33604]